MLRLQHFIVAAAAVAAVLTAGAANAVTVAWANLTSDNGSSVFGSIGATGVTYSGGYSFDQLNGAGTDYWTTAVPGNYTQGVVNRPTTSDIVALSAANIGTITFSQPVTNVFIAFNSWNGANVTFDHPFTVVSQGCGYWGCGSFVPNGGNTGFTGSGETVGILEFVGTMSSLTFTDTVGENWHGFTFGIQAVPEPMTWALMLVGFCGVGAAIRAHRKAATVAA